MKDLAYQQHAIRKLESTSNELLNSGENNTLIFKAPTGSGKTVKMAEILKEFVSNRIDGKEFSFEFLIVSPSVEKIALAFQKTLEVLGIKMSIRTVDSSQYQTRMLNWRDKGTSS